MGRVPVLPLLQFTGNGAGMAVGTHDSGYGIVVRNGDRRQVQHGRTLYIFPGVGGPGEEGKVGGDGQFNMHGRMAVYSPFVLFSSPLRNCAVARNYLCHNGDTFYIITGQGAVGAYAVDFV